MSAQEKVKCKVQVGYGWSKHQCSRGATRDGYCGTHHPDATKARRAKLDAKWQAKQAYWKWQTEERKAITFVVQTAVEWERGEADGDLLRQAVSELKRARRGLREASGPTEQDTPQ